MSAHDVVITGIGLVSSLGEGAEAHWTALSAGPPAPVVDSERFAPFSFHPLPEIDWSRQIAKRGDQRQMETWQRLGTYTAGLALDEAGMKGDEALVGSMDMVIAAGGGERDAAVDAAILAASQTRADREVLLNEKLTTELRPTLFLAQLSNLLAGNISIVHKVTGSSRTFMGEEGAAVSAVDTAFARIRSGQATHVLVGGAFQSEHPDMLLGYELGGYLHRGPHAPVWQRQGMPGGGIVSGSGSAFLVLEQREHAEKRGRKAYAELLAVTPGRSKRDAGYEDALASIYARTAKDAENLLVVSGASGAHAATAAEQAVLARRGAVVRGYSSLIGHVKEAQFFVAVALAALAVGKGKAFSPFDGSEKPFSGPLTGALATTVGYHYFEGMALVAAAE
ncbi:beta-ketoacyl-ACP synthase [Kumtagia ephedrae]|uniref:Beta-ketoacyl-ACP synthase II n=1 Tax=Kumtagia ephedrae TaxID=2116701 RepID=A0A2P7SC06_9HYPH|nr:beta-ketoacyl-ACP synthase [Mesorhizobium ephedrae]PSJ60037.1 beta-ketoacyl-ACP synthase II [Mesorhizobium ephedrae]